MEYDVLSVTWPYGAVVLGVSPPTAGLVAQMAEDRGWAMILTAPTEYFCSGRVQNYKTSSDDLN